MADGPQKRTLELLLLIMVNFRAPGLYNEQVFQYPKLKIILEKPALLPLVLFISEAFVWGFWII